MRIYNILNLDFGTDRLKEMVINNFNAISASINSIVSQVRVNKDNISRNADVLSRAVVTDKNGNIAYGGFSIPTTLSPLFRYEFYDASCVMVRKDGGAGNYYTCNNCYYDGSTWIGMTTIAISASYTSLTGTSFLIRQSSAGSVTAGDDLGTFVTVITPS
jgi:hypothetical protein